MKRDDLELVVEAGSPTGSARGLAEILNLPLVLKYFCNAVLADTDSHCRAAGMVQDVESVTFRRRRLGAQYGRHESHAVADRGMGLEQHEVVFGRRAHLQRRDDGHQLALLAAH